MPGSLRRASMMQLLMQRIAGPKRVDLPISVYGKLPLYKDFLRHGLAGSECQAFKRWLDQGISQHWAGSEQRRDFSIGTHALFLTFPATRRRLLVYLWGSTDAGGLRTFPFAIFVSLPIDRRITPLAHFEALGQVMEQAGSVRRQIEKLDSVERFQPLVRTTSLSLVLQEPPSPDAWLEERTGPTIGEFASSLYPKEKGRGLRALLRILDRLRGRQGVALRVPLSNLLPPELQAGLWTLLLEETGAQAMPLQVIFGDDAESGLTLIHRDLRSDDVFALHPDLFEYEFVTDLRTELPSLEDIPELSSEQSDSDLSKLLDGSLLQA